MVTLLVILMCLGIWIACNYRMAAKNWETEYGQPWEMAPSHDRWVLFGLASTLPVGSVLFYQWPYGDAG